MTRNHLKLVPPGRKASLATLPEVLLVRRLDEVRELWLALPFSWFFPGAWFALFAAMDRLEAQRIRTLKGW